jgi:uncharacterized protein (TIRG00374 family)
MRRTILITSILIGLAAFAYILTTIDLVELYNLVTRADPLYLILFIITATIMFVGFTTIWWVTNQPYDFTIPPLRLFNYRMVGLALSYVTPGPRVGGEIVRANLDPDHRSELLVSSVIEKICLAFSSAAVITGGIIAAPFLFTIETIVAPTVLAVVVTITYVIYYLGSRADKAVAWLDWLGLIPQQYIDSVDGFTADITAYFTDHRDILVIGTTVGLICKLLLVFQLYFLLAMLGLDVTLLQSFYLAVAVEVAYAIPGYMGIGVLEAGQISTLALLSFPNDVGVLTAMITRLRDLTASAYGLAALSYYTNKT